MREAVGQGEPSSERAPLKRNSSGKSARDELGFTDAIQGKIERMYNSHEITEKAAIAVMSLLIHELECVQLVRVLPIKGGADYAGVFLPSNEPVQVEVSGIREGHPSVSKDRLEEKRTQVLKGILSKGFVSVTTFYQIHGGTGVAQSYLHHVESNKP